MSKVVNVSVYRTSVWWVAKFLFGLLASLLGFYWNCAHAATATGFPSTCSSTTGVGTNSWSKPTRAYSSNNSYATSSLDGTTSVYLKCTGYGFSIPTGATINGIKVNVERKSNSTADGGSKDAAMRIVKAGSIGTQDRSTSTGYTTSDVSEAHGSATDLWGTTWTPADINATTFGAAFAATKSSSAGYRHTVSVDVISIAVDYTLDTTPPTVSSINRASLNPTGATSVVWTVVFSENVTGVDSTDFAVAQGTGLSGASVASISGSGNTYSVTVNTGSGSGSLGLNLVDNDSIVDTAAAANKLGGNGNNNGNFTGQTYTIDKTNPFVSSLNIASSNPTAASSVSWLVTFSETVTGVDAGDFALVQGSGLTSASITSVSGTGSSYTVTVNTGSGSGTLGLNLVDNDTIVDGTNFKLGGNGTGNGNATGQVYSVDRTPPSVTSINTADVNPSSLDSVSWTVVFSESVSNVDVSDFSLVASSNLKGAYITSVLGSGTTWTVVMNTGICADSCTLGLNLVDDDSITDGTANKLGGTGSGNGSFTGQVYTLTTPPISRYHMDEIAWNGTIGEVNDDVGGADGTAYNNATTSAGDTGSCRYGVFDTRPTNSTITTGGVLLPDFPDLADDFTITAWIRTTDNTKAAQRIFIDDETNTTGYGLSLGDPGTGKLRFYSRIPSLNLDTGSVISSNTWYFVAAVIDIANNNRIIYVFDATGALVTSVSSSSTSWGGGDLGDATRNGDASIGAETINAASGETPGNGYHFRGNLDEVAVYGKVLTQAALAQLAQTTHACATAGPNHLRIDHDGQGQSCVSESMTVTACTNLDSGSPATCSPYTGGITGNLLVKNSGATVLSTVPFTIASGSSSTVVTVPALGAQTVNFDTSGLSVAAANATTCWNTGAAQALCTMAVSACPGGSSGANFNCLDNSITPYSSANARLYTQVVGSPFSVGVVALNASGGQESNYVISGGTTKTLTLELVDGAGSTACASRAPLSPAVSQTLTLTASDAGRKATANMTVSNAYSNLRCRVTDAQGYVGCSTDGFSVRPSSLALSSSTASADGAGLSASAIPAIKTGAAFSLNATSSHLNYDGTPKLDGNKLVAHSGAVQAGILTGSFSSASSVSGIASGSNFTYSEVGYFSLLAQGVYDDNFTVIDQTNGDCTADFSNTTVNGKVGCKFGNVAQTNYFGRFIPDHLVTQVASQGSFAHACSSFSYNGQSISYASNQRPMLTVTAYNAASPAVVTKNYTGSFARLQTSQFTRTTPTTDASQKGADNNQLVKLAANLATPSLIDNGNGSLTYLLGDDNFTYQRESNALIAPFSNAIAIRINSLTDSDGVAATTLPMTLQPAGETIRYGRIALSNAYGSEMQDLPMTMQAEYFDGKNFVSNTQDSCSTATLQVTDTLATDALQVVDSCIWDGSGLSGSQACASNTPSGKSYREGASLSGGNFNLTLKAPSKVGSLTVTATVANWLKFNWKGAGTNDPAAVATFGLYKPSEQVIFFREVY